MKVDNFVLLIISIVTLIIISLLTECNRGRLTELENKATKEIVETFFHLGSAEPTEPGQWGYLITGITEGKYGGRSRQEVLNKLLEVGSHNEGDYISESEKQNYGSGLFDSTISGIEKNKVRCTPPLPMDPTQDDDVYCEDICVDNKLTYKYTDYVPAEYGGECDGIENIIIDDNGTYKYITEGNKSVYETRCLKTDYNIRDDSSLLQITLNIDNTITIVESTWCGFFSSEEVSEELFDDRSKLSEASDSQTNPISLTLDEKARLYNNQFASTDILSNYDYKKYTIDNNYYYVIYEKLIFTSCGNFQNNGPTQEHCDNEYNTKYVPNLVTVDSGDSGKQIWRVSKTGQYKITTIGADGGGINGGKGYLMSANFNLDKNEEIVMIIGQIGSRYKYYNLNSSAGGGGGTFVLYNNNNNPIIISGGGGGGSGGSDHSSSGGGDAVDDGAGGGGYGGDGGSSNPYGSGGYGGGGGGGFRSGGGRGDDLNGGDGGRRWTGGRNPGILIGKGDDGGFGGGGAGGANGYSVPGGGGGGGGGGYSGGHGGSGDSSGGGGGGSSYVNNDHIVGSILEARVASSSDGRSNRYGNGEVFIEYIGPQIGSS